MPTVTFGRAVRKNAHVIITAYGESGSGKTYSLIKLGRGLVGSQGKLGLLDTETGRGLIYARVAGGYEYAELTPPFTPERYIEALDAAEEAGIEALIIDSGSHEWEGIGGIIEMADSQTSQTGAALSGLVKWAKPKIRHKKYISRLLSTRMHLLIALRAKEKMVQLTNKMKIPDGAKVGDIISEGLVPIQDKRFKFEATVQLFMPTTDDRNRLGIPVVEKCPEDLWGAFPEGSRLSEDTGARIAEWINGGAPVDHDFERMKRAAEEAASGGVTALRNYWNATIDSAQRDRLEIIRGNLLSIAKAADQEQEERRREREGSHTVFGHVGEIGEPQPHSPAGTTSPPSTTTEERTVAGDPPSPAVGTLRTDAATKPAGEVEIADLLGGKARTPNNLRVELKRVPTDNDLSRWSQRIDELLSDGHAPAAIRAANEDHIENLRRIDPHFYEDLMRKLGARTG